MRTLKRHGKAPFKPQVEVLELRALLATILVDDDKVQCPTAPFTSINAAVLVASPGDTIKVCPGLYNESVQVPKTLTFRGAFAGQNADARSSDAPNPTRDSIVDPPDAATNGFNVLANDVVIDGFTVQGTSGAGIQTSPAFSGYKIRNNEIRDNTFGLYFHSSGATPSTAERNAFVANNRPGAAAGNGIYADQGTQNASIVRNTFRQHTNAGIVFATAGTPQNDVTIAQNLSVDDATFVALFNSKRFDVEQNTILDTIAADNPSQGSKIFVGGDSQDIVVSHNVIFGGGFDGIAVRDTLGAPGNTKNVQIVHNAINDVDRDGISVTAAAPGAAEVESNRVSGVDRNGIYLGPGTSGNLVSHNDIARNGQDGISLEDSDNNRILHNSSERNGRDGIRVDALSTGNLIEHNRMSGNAEDDCHDDSVGPGTAGTANTWRKNRGNTENRPGLCRPTGGDD